MKIFYYLIITSVFLFSSCESNKIKDVKVSEYPFYDIHLKINPQNQEISVTGKLLINKSKDSLNQLFFYLQKDMDIDFFTINQKNIFERDTSKSDNRFMPQATKIHLKPGNHMVNENIEIYFSYNGKLADLPEYFANIISPEWTEIGLYYPWFPYNPELRPFTYRLTVETGPCYKVFSLGKIEKKQDAWVITNNMPTNDIVVCVSKDVMSYESQIGQSKLTIFHHNFNDTLLSKMSGDISNIVKQYNDWFGENAQDISIIESKRKKGGGYARIGGVFLGGFNPEVYYSNNEGYHRYFAHELGHLWWYKAKTNSWEDWLNESFAEYSALMIIREVFGEDAFTKRLDKKRENLEDTTPIWEFDRNRIETEEESRNIDEVLYNKGPVLLYELEKEISKEHFIELCKILFEKNIYTTSEFLETLKLAEGENVSVWFKKMLKTK
ncbi:MAG: hypothetical protein K8R31_11515 [Bacteroidales bacterium]|nr:hypothetical protein [Bacteroidales bacterium]